MRFADAIQALAADGYGTFVEVSPHPTLETAIADTIEENGAGPVPVISGTLRRDSAGAAQVLAVLAQAFARGVPVDWAAVLGGGRRVDLPTYAFQHQRYWPQAAPGPAPRRAGTARRTAAEAWFWAAVEGGDAQALAETLAVPTARGWARCCPRWPSWRRRERDRSVTETWRYRITWVPVAEPDRVALSGTWLVVAPAGPAGGLARACARALEARGARVVLAEAAPD